MLVIDPNVAIYAKNTYNDARRVAEIRAPNGRKNETGARAQDAYYPGSSGPQTENGLTAIGRSTQQKTSVKELFGIPYYDPDGDGWLGPEPERSLDRITSWYKNSDDTIDTFTMKMNAARETNLGKGSPEASVVTQTAPGGRSQVFDVYQNLESNEAQHREVEVNVFA